MADDEKKFSNTLRLGSEDWFELPCSPCARDGKDLPAIKFCVECDENLCSSCLTHHNKFPVMRVHQITDNLSSRTGQRPQLPTERCNRHGGKLVDVYCPTHDVVGCSTCITVEHSSRHGIRYIPDMTQDLQLSKEFVDLETKVKRLLVLLDQIKQKKQNHLKRLQQEKDQLLQEIQALRKQINEKLDEMEKMIVDDVDTKVGAQVHDISKEIDVNSNEKMTLERRQMSIKNTKSSSKADMFIRLKMSQADMQKSERSLELMRTDSHEPTMTVKILPDDNVHRLLKSKSTMLGKTSRILIPKSIKQEAAVDVRYPSDAGICKIRAICLTSDSKICFADMANRRIKELDQSYEDTDFLDMPDYVWGLCEADNTRLAVTLVNQKKVQFVSRNPLTLRDSYTVGDRCKGIDYHNGQLYVCCGGDRGNGEGPGHIEVYNVGGDLLRAYYQGASWPLYVHVSERGNLIISNKDTINLVTLRMTNQSVSDMQINALREPVGMCRVGDSQVCVAGYTSNNIVMISEDGELQQEVLTQTDGISDPVAVCFNEQNSCLMVSYGTCDTLNSFQVFT